jgi:lipid II:glycine glycyltransferase (peptidoglycan interpeptide bridge formation enzyme)
MTIQPCTKHLAWKEWELAHPDLSFLQSWEWGEFQRGAGYAPVRWQLFDQGKPTTQVQGFLHHIMPGVSYLYLPRMYSAECDLIALRQAAKAQHIDFLRIEPMTPLKVAGVKAVSTHLRQPAQTLVLDLDQSEAELRAGMHTKTRYNIRVAEKHGIEIEARKDADIFWKIKKPWRGMDSEVIKKYIMNV